jgi:predicted RNA-binding protein
MKYWIVSLPREDTEHCLKIGTFGRSQKHVLGKVQEGDKLAFYVTKDRKIVAHGTVTKPYYYDEKKIFKAEGVFPHRFDFTAKKLDQEAEFMRIIDKMSFITNLAFWSVYLRLGLKEISADDWKQIQSL